MKKISTDICVIGAGSGGLSVAAGAVQMGARVVLIEAGEMGGDCLNYGCVPSKALLAAGKHAHMFGHSEAFGIAAAVPQVDFKKVHDHVKDVIATIAPIDSQERFEGLGVTVIREFAKFKDARTVVAGETEITARRIVVATGSSPMEPPIPGLDSVPFFTNETIFDNEVLPEHLIVIGGGPIGMEMSQAHRRLGAKVTTLEGGTALGKDDPELTAIVKRRLVEEGIDLRENAMVQRIEKADSGVRVVFEKDGREQNVEGSHLLLAVGRAANVNGLELEKAGIEYSRRGITVDERLRTTNKKVFAIGDVSGGLQFTHVAGYHAGIVIRNALFKLPAKADHSAVPWVTYTDPEMAHVGLTEAQARDAHGDKARVLHWGFDENDRAQAERRTEGLIKVMTNPKGVVIGASIVGAGAGDLLAPWILAVGQKQKIGTMAQFIAPYPTMTEVSKRAAGSYYTGTLYSPRTRFVVRLLMRLFG
ncbi:FAD-dependent oxidoreductase [Pyruvatibacter sp.]|uniref:dihydrolipoyl dehydrogenase family protein n=1 Tax=Pyruvatibacter sp. TaxID=1981328 RepID=UPI0032EFB507